MKKSEAIAHKTAGVIRAVGGKEKCKSTGAVIAAAGDSSRMQGLNKQFILLDGIEVLARSIRAFQAADCIREIAVVTQQGDIEKVIGLCDKYGFSKVIAVVPGGCNRQESVYKGFCELSDKNEFVAVHDGARCLVTPEIIEKVCREAYIFKAAIAATRVTDTVKRTEKGAFVDETFDRNRVWLAQTPQVFDSNLYRAAAYTATNDKFFGTDDASLAEHIGFKAIRLVECGKENIKLTTPDDVYYAEALLTVRKKRRSIGGV